MNEPPIPKQTGVIKMARQGGRQKGSPNISPLEKIKQNRHRLEKMLLDKALAGDVQAIQACLELLDGQTDRLAEAEDEEG